MNLESVLSLIGSNFLYVIYAMLIFSVLILGHELGHFVLAKLNKVKVEEFSIGMGPKLFGIKPNETLYAIRLFPIGGYVKMLGDEGESSDERAFNSKSPLRKLSIVAAGPLMNFVIAILFFTIVTSFVGYTKNEIGTVMDGKPAMEANLKPGDKLVKVNGKSIGAVEEFIQVVGENKDKPMAITIERDGKSEVKTLTPTYNKETKTYMIGISFAEVTNPTIIQSIGHGFQQTGYVMKLTFDFFGKLFSGKTNAQDFGGPVSIIKISVSVAKLGFLNLLYFGALMSVQLAIFNIIPFPALDGGYIFLNLFQIITGKKVDDNKVGIINTVGFMILMLLMVAVTVKDILYPINF